MILKYANFQKQHHGLTSHFVVKCTSKSNPLLRVKAAILKMMRGPISCLADTFTQTNSWKDIRPHVDIPLEVKLGDGTTFAINRGVEGVTTVRDLRQEASICIRTLIKLLSKSNIIIRVSIDHRSIFLSLKYPLQGGGMGRRSWGLWWITNSRDGFRNSRIFQLKHLSFDVDTQSE